MAAEKQPGKKQAAHKNNPVGHDTHSRPTPATLPRATVPASAAGGVGIRVRMYRVGFGDFFLLSLPGADGKPLHILIDCGVHAVDLGSIGDAIKDMATVTGGQLALVIMTHRHADHISGFATGASVFAGFTVERVWMSWFENPSNKDAVKFQNSLTAVASNLQFSLAGLAATDGEQFLNMAQNATGDLAAVGGKSGNEAALDVLHGGFKNQAPVDYYQAGDTPTLPNSLISAGLTATILGPPIDPDLIAEMDNKAHQYLAATPVEDANPKKFDPAFISEVEAYPPEAFQVFTAAEIAKSVAGNQPNLAVAQAQNVDNTINNQSLVILFSFKGKTLLFVGDAQWGNWQNFLFGGALGTAGHERLTDKAQSILGNIAFYKVGHHGSTNATPIDALNAMRQDCVAMCSTQPGAYGKLANNSEVPRTPLIAALEKKTDNEAARSDQVHVPGADNPIVVQKAAPFGPPGKLPPDFTAGPGGELYVDYNM